MFAVSRAALVCLGLRDAQVRVHVSGQGQQQYGHHCLQKKSGRVSEHRCPMLTSLSPAETPGVFASTMNLSWIGFGAFGISCMGDSHSAVAFLIFIYSIIFIFFVVSPILPRHRFAG